MHIKEL